MKQDVVDISGAVVGSIDLDDSVWGAEPNVAVMHQALVMQLANARQGTSSTKTRAEVRGGGRKPWRQKGTGRARHGSIRSPLWAGGGVTFGPRPRKYTQRMPKKMRQLAVRSALSAKMSDERIIVVEGLDGIEPRTKAMVETVSAFPEGRSYLVVVPEKYQELERASSNLDNVTLILSGYLNVRDVLKFDQIVVSRSAIELIEAHLALPANKREPSVWQAARQAAQEESARV